MGFQHPLLVSLDLKGMVLENEGKSYTKWNKVNMITKGSGAVVQNKRTPKRRRILKMRGTGRRLQSARKHGNGIQTRVKTLKRLIPNTDPSMGLDGLFRETADYILSMQSRVRLMQIMVQALAPASHHE